MKKPHLRYYKKPKSNFAKKLELLKFDNGVLIFCLLFLVCFILLFLPSLINSYYNAIDILPLNDNAIDRLVESKKSSFYVKDNNQYLFAKKIDNIYFTPIRNSQENIQLELGNYLDFVFLKIPLAPRKSIEVKSNFAVNQDYELVVEEESTKTQFNYMIRTNKTDEITIFEGKKQAYPNNSETNQSVCKKTLDNNTILYSCNKIFNENNKSILDLVIKDKNGIFYQIIENKVISRKIDNNLECKINQKLTLGENKIECTLKVPKKVTIQEQEYDFQANVPNVIVVDLIEGKNKILVTDSDGNSQELVFVINNDLKIEIIPAKNLYNLESPINLELNIKTNQSAKINITANAKSTTAGYLEYNSKKIETDFSNLKFVAKDIEISPDSNNSPIIFQIDTKTYDYKNQVSLYPDIIDLLIEVKSSEGLTKKITCKMNIKITDKSNTPSTCQIVDPS